MVEPQEPQIHEKPEQEEALSRVFVVQTQYASQNRIDKSIEISDMKREIDYTFSKKVRRMIGVIRERSMKQLRAKTVDYPPEWDRALHLCNESQKEEITNLTRTADKQFQALSPELHAQVVFLELNIHEIQRGDLYGQVISAIRFKIMHEIIKKIGEKVGQLPAKNKDAMIKLIKRLKYVNVLNDPEVDSQLKSIQEKILTEDIAAVKAELTKDLAFTKQRITYVDL